MSDDRSEAELQEQVARVRAFTGADELIGLLERLADRYEVAFKRKETGEATIRVKFHRGKHEEFRWSADERVMRESRR